MGLREGNEFTNNIYVIMFSLVGFVALEFATMSFQILNGDIFINVFVGMLQLLAAVIVNLLFGRIGFITAIITSILQIGLFSYDYIHYFRNSSAVLVAFALSAILLNFVIQFFLDSVYSRMFRVKNLYNQTRERLFKVTEENSKKANEKPVEKIIVKHDESVAKRNEIKSVTLNLDPLTTLPNRTKIIKHLEDWIDDSTSMMQSGGGVNKNSDYSVSLIYLVFNNFDKLLHSLGHRKLDLYIQCTAHKLREVASPSDIVGRIEAGEFAIVTKRQLSKEEMRDYCKTLSDVIINSFKCEDSEITVNTTAGIASFPHDARFSGDLLNCAEYAVSEIASRTGGTQNTIEWFSNVNEGEKHNLYALTNDKERLAKIEKLLPSAIEKKQIYLAYQPQYNSKNELVGFESFLRWNSPELGNLKAGEFIPAAETTGLIYKLGQYSIDTGLKFLSKVNALNKSIKLTLNFSALELKFGDTPGVLADLMSRYNINPANVTVDIPEECLVSSFDMVKPTLGYISSLGITMNLDNFGRGYSSLNNIPLLPISSIKIDGYFTKNVNNDKNTQVITSSIINLMHEIDINVCATGVGSKEQYEKLLGYGCDYFQGQEFGGAISEQDALKLVSSVE